MRRVPLWLTGVIPVLAAAAGAGALRAGAADHAGGGDRAVEAVTRYNVAMIHRAQGELDRSVAELEQVVELDRQVGHPDLQSDTEMLHRVRQELASSDPGRGSR